jgi:hypothetical protein
VNEKIDALREQLQAATDRKDYAAAIVAERKLACALEFIKERK